MSEVIVAAQFRGPPNSGNGGYVCGLLAGALPTGPVRCVLRAPVPVDAPLSLTTADGVARLATAQGELIAEAVVAEAADLPEPPPPPGYDEAIDASLTFVGLGGRFHPICFTCADALGEGFGLRVFVGQLAQREPGLVAGPWTPHASFCDDSGLATLPTLWAALDCPGSVAWVVGEGGGGLLGTMTGEVLRRPEVGEPCIVFAWRIEASGRKRVSGTALFTARGERLALARQIWIVRASTAA